MSYLVHSGTTKRTEVKDLKPGESYQSRPDWGPVKTYTIVRIAESWEVLLRGAAPDAVHFVFCHEDQKIYQTSSPDLMVNPVDINVTATPV